MEELTGKIIGAGTDFTPANPNGFYSNEFYDAVIVGGGPAGLSAAIYMARAKYRTLVIEKAEIGGQITITDEIVNYPGVEKMSGRELTGQMRRQAEAFGAEFLTAEVLAMDLDPEIKQLHTTNTEGKTLQSPGVILAPGASPRKLGFKGEREFQGHGVAYCATCDGEFFTGMEVFVIGGGFAAAEEGLFLTRYAKKVIFIIREKDFTCAKSIADKVEAHDKTEIYFETEILEVSGETVPTHARFRDNRNQKEWTHDNKEGFGVFVFAGYVPNTDWITDKISKNKQGYILTDENRRTNLDGVYAAGDVCVKELRQVVTAVADGAIAATSLEKELAAFHEKKKIPPLFTDAAKSDSDSRQRQYSLPEKSENEGPFSGEENFFTPAMKEQLHSLFAKFSNRVLLRAWLDDSPLSAEIKGFLEELCSLTDRIFWKEAPSETMPVNFSGKNISGKETGIQNTLTSKTVIRPSIELCYPDGKSSGIHFHGVPGGHEINSFLAALYNVVGPGQDISPALKEQVYDISKKLKMKILVSLSCAMCPETVTSAQKIASLSDKVEAEMFDLAHFPDLKKKYNVMSVPCLIIDDRRVYFGKKNVEEILGDILNCDKL